MAVKKIHHLREILVTDAWGKTTSTMQYSFDNASYLQPVFFEVPFNEQVQARELYAEHGGRRAEEIRIGPIIIIP